MKNKNVYKNKLEAIKFIQNLGICCAYLETDNESGIGIITSNNKNYDTLISVENAHFLSVSKDEVDYPYKIMDLMCSVLDKLSIKYIRRNPGRLDSSIKLFMNDVSEKYKYRLSVDKIVFGALYGKGKWYMFNYSKEFIETLKDEHRNALRSYENVAKFNL